MNIMILISLIQKYCYSLNKKQYLVIFMIMNALITHYTQTTDSDKLQLMTYVNKKNDTDKN